MKFQFTLGIEGNESIEKKFKDAMEDNPQIHVELIKAFANAIMLGLRIKPEDNLVVTSFRAGKIEEIEEQEKKVDN